MATDLKERALNDPVVLALAVIGARIRDLPKDDREDLYELSKALFDAECDEEIDAARRGMLEILDQTGSRVLDMSTDRTGQELQKWMDYVGPRIRQHRERAGLTQDELAEKAGLPQSHISKLETGKHSPSHATLKKIADALEIELSSLDPSA